MSQGYPNSYPEPPAKKGMSTAAVVLLILAGVVVLGFAGCATCVLVGAKKVGDAADDYKSKRESEKQRASADEADAKRAAQTVKISDFLGAYKANEIAADARFKDHYVIVSGGKVIEIRKTVGDQAVLWVNESGNRQGPTLHCFLTPDYVSQAATLKKGAYVKVAGKVSGMIIHDVMLKNCEL